MIPEEALSRVTREAERRGVSTAAIVREAVETYLPAHEPGRPLAFFGAAEGTPADSEEIDDVVGEAIDRQLGEDD